MQTPIALQRRSSGNDPAAAAGGGRQYEAVVLSEVWQVFEQLIKEVPPPHPPTHTW